MVERAHKGFGERERQDSVAQQTKAAGGRGHEAGAFARFFDDFSGRAHALGAVVGQQSRRGLTPAHQPQPPGQGLRVLEARVGPSNTKDGQQMGGVAHEQGAPHQVVGQGERTGRIHRAPVHLPGLVGVADHGQLRIDAGFERFGRQGLLGRFALGQLVVHAPDAQGLPVQEHGVATVPFGVKKGQALGGQRQVNADVGDDKSAFVRRAFELEVQQAADQ